MPINVSCKINSVQSCRGIDARALCRSSSSIGDSAPATEMAMKSLMFMGTRWLEIPGANIMQPPILQNSRHKAMICASMVFVMTGRR